MQLVEDKHLTKALVMTDEYLQWAITTPLYNIGENVYQLSNEYKNAHPGIAWMRIAGLRHRLVHDYDNTNWSIICDVVFDELPELLQALEETEM